MANNSKNKLLGAVSILNCIFFALNISALIYMMNLVSVDVIGVPPANKDVEYLLERSSFNLDIAVFMIAILAIIMAILSIFGYTHIKESAERIAENSAEKIAKEEMKRFFENQKTEEKEKAEFKQEPSKEKSGNLVDVPNPKVDKQ